MSAGGFLRRRDLLRLGCSDSAIRAALRRGSIERVRHGWYVSPHMPETARRAVRLGGLLTGSAALQSYGIWAPRTTAPDYRVSAHAARLRTPGDAKRRLGQHPDAASVRWSGPSPKPAQEGLTWRVTVAEALADLLRTADRISVLSACDSAQHLGMISAAELDLLFARAPERTRHWRDLVDGRAEAGGETAVRILLLDAGLAAEPQFPVPGAGRYDLRIEQLLIEVDGRAHHDDREAFHRDRARDLMAAFWGFRVLHLSYAQIEREWPLCLAAIRSSLAR